MGTRHRLTGRLLESRRGLILEVDDGGSFALDTMRSARKFLGLRVTIDGTRAGFDLIEVERIRPAGD
ncbi:DUF5818 domain-containing protein [Sphingomonas koreensis]